ncbi:MAG: LuxR C-terminal-related transcriptional regulator [Blastococcus sp.]
MTQTRTIPTHSPGDVTAGTRTTRIGAALSRTPARRIAAELQVSSKTVANHVSHILTKLQARDRVDAVLRARNSER